MIKKILHLTFITAGLITLTPSMDTPEISDGDQYALLIGPGMPFETLPLPEIIKLIDSQADNKLAFHLRFTCKTLYNQQFDIAMTLPRSFIPTDLDAFSLIVAPAALNLYNLSDDVLQEFGFIVPPKKVEVQSSKTSDERLIERILSNMITVRSLEEFLDQPDDQIKEESSPQKENKLPPLPDIEVSTSQDAPSSLLRLLNYPTGQLKILVLREDLKLTNSLKIVLNDKNIKIETLPYAPESYNYFNTRYLGNRHLNLLIHFYKDARRCEGTSFGFGRALQEGYVPNNGDDLKGVLDNYEKIIKNPWGANQIRELTHKGKIRRPLLKYKNNSQMRTAIIWICHCNKLRLDLIEDLIYKIDEKNALSILDFFNKFVPDYDFNKSEALYFKYCGNINSETLDQNILDRDQNFQKHNLTRMQAFMNGLDALCSFDKKVQLPLIKRLFSILNLNHLKNLQSRQITYSSFNEIFECALRIVHDQLLPLTEEEFLKFLTYLSNNRMTINLLEEGAEDHLRDLLE